MPTWIGSCLDIVTVVLRSSPVAGLDHPDARRARLAGPLLPNLGAAGYNWCYMACGAANSADQPLIQPLCAIFRRFLKRRGLKFTPERAKILDAVLGKQGVFEAEQLMYEMRKSKHRVSKATIYRTLKHLLEANIIGEVLLDSKQAHYQLTFGLQPTGHLVCLETNQIIELAMPQLTKLRDRICREHGFNPVSFRFVVYGISPQARKAQDASGAALTRHRQVAAEDPAVKWIQGVADRT